VPAPSDWFWQTGASGTTADSCGPTATPGDATVLRVVNYVSLESYLRSVVPSESPSSWRRAALQAQAVAARTYAMWRRAYGNLGYADICDTTACQVYHGLRLLDPSGTVVRTY